MIFKSIKWRLQLWYGLILLGVLVAFGYTAFELERSRQFRRIDDELRRRVNMIANALRPLPRGRGPEELPPAGQPPRPQPDRPRPLRDQPPTKDFRLPPEAARLFEGAGTNGYYYVVFGRDQNELSRSDNVPGLEAVRVNGGFNQSNPTRPEEVPPGNRPTDFRGNVSGELPVPGRPTDRRDDALRIHGEFREIEIFTPPGERILVGRSVTTELLELRRSALKLTAVGSVILLLGLAGGWWIATRAIRPIARISAAATQISGGNLTQRINAGETESELGQLAIVLNDTFGRLEAAFEQQRQFTADAAHELRTPVSVILTQAQSTLTRERSPAEYRETLEACQRAAQRMRRLIESLLELARLDGDPDVGRREPLDLAQVAADCLELVRPLADGRRITIQTNLAPAVCLGDNDRLALVITNLLTNALHYNRDGGEVEIGTRSENDSAIVTVTDNGLGIASEHLPHIFDRFYRADAARTSAQGRTGLGLAIAHAIVEAHGGTIQVTSEPGKGSAFEVRLPTAKPC